MVLNNSKVVPARLLGKKESTGANVEIFLLKKISDEPSYEALLRPQKRLKEGERVIFEGSKIYAEVIDQKKRIVRFNAKDVESHLERIGHVPLPPYIKRPDESADREFYQTVYARHYGSVAAPTAGLHFTDALMNDLKGCGHGFCEVTLHINYATFKPVEEEDITRHQMHIEHYSMSAPVLQDILKTKESGQKIVAVGTTSCRVLESYAKTGRLEGETNLFIYPGYDFRLVDVLLTNFHLPQSTLLMLVSAFGGLDLIQQAYREAVKEKYRFFSYGDAMLIL